MTELSGTIISSLTEEPLAGVKLVVDNEVITATDANGSFSLFLHPGKHKVWVKMNGKDSELVVKLNEKHKDLKLIRLDPYKKNKLTFD